MSPYRFAVALALMLAVSHIGAQAPIVRVDPRIELTTIVFRLIEANEYNQCRVPKYAADIDRYFDASKGQRALTLARRIREEFGIGFDAVPFFALSLTNPPQLGPRVLLGDSIRGIGDKRWVGPHAREFAAALREFAITTKFNAFFAQHRLLYDTTEARMRRFIKQEIDLGRIATFFGEAPRARFYAIPGICNGGANYGPRVQPLKGPEERFAVIGMSNVDSLGFPMMDSEDVSLLVHEFNHSYVNPIVERHLGAFQQSAKALMTDSVVRELMAAQAYSEGETVIKESIVRSAVVIYLRATKGEEAAQQALRDEYGRGFVWIRGLDSALTQYQRERATYRTLTAFVPELAKFFASAANGLPSELRKFEALRPQVVATSPGRGTDSVSAADTTISVTFDRPMRRGTWINYGPLGEKAYPKVTRVGWDASRTMLTLYVRLEPATTYEMHFRGAGFRSAEGVPGSDWLFRFRTR